MKIETFECDICLKHHNQKGVFGEVREAGTVNTF